MLPGFTAAALLEDARPDGIAATAHWAAARGVRIGAGVYAQERMMMSERGGGELGYWGSHEPAVVCSCPCCQTHSCGFLGLSTCLTCC